MIAAYWWACTLYSYSITCFYMTRFVGLWSYSSRINVLLLRATITLFYLHRCSSNRIIIIIPSIKFNLMEGVSPTTYMPRNNYKRKNYISLDSKFIGFLKCSARSSIRNSRISYKLEVAYGKQGDVSKQATPMQLSVLCGPNLQFIFESNIDRSHFCPRNSLFGSKDAL